MQTIFCAKKDLPGVDILKMFFAILIIAMHTNAFSSIPIVFKQFMRVLMDYAVPGFFVISSYLFFRKIRISPSLFESFQSLKHFLKRLLILYCFWSILFLSIYIDNYYEYSLLKAFCLFIRDFFLGGTFPTSWFFPALMISVLFVYITRFIVSDIYIYVCAVIVLIYIYNQQYMPDIFRIPFNWYQENIRTPFLSFPRGMFWVGVGYLLSDPKINMLYEGKAPMKFFIFSLLLSVGICVVQIIFSIGREVIYIETIVVVSLFIGAYNININFRNYDLMKQMRHYSVLFYCTHYFFLGVVSFLSRKIGVVLDPFYSFLIVLFLCFLISKLIFWLKSFPRCKWLCYAY